MSRPPGNRGPGTIAVFVCKPEHPTRPSVGERRWGGARWVRTGHPRRRPARSGRGSPPTDGRRPPRVRTRPRARSAAAGCPAGRRCAGWCDASPLARAPCAAISGAAGLVSGACLILFFGLARPFSGEPSPWSWLGPANDLTSAVHAAALIPVALTLGDLGPGRSVRRWTTIGVSAMAAATILPRLLVASILPLTVQARLVTIAIVIMFCWMLASSVDHGSREQGDNACAGHPGARRGAGCRATSGIGRSTGGPRRRSVSMNRRLACLSVNSRDTAPFGLDLPRRARL